MKEITATESASPYLHAVEPFLQLIGIQKREQETEVLRGVSFEMKQGEKLAIAGATGSGKTTLLKIIGGWGQADAGTVRFKGKKVLGSEEKLMPGHKGIAYLSQHFELPGYYRVEEILDHENKLLPSDAAQLYRLCRIDHLLTRRTDQLSGGEKQRISLARRLITSPELLLLDEPFSNMDTHHTRVLKEVIDALCDQLNITVILVSHEATDSLSWADTIVVLKEGTLVQKDRPSVIYRQPADRYVAGLFGLYTELTNEQVALLQTISPPGVPVKNIWRPDEFEWSASGEGLEVPVLRAFYYGFYDCLEVGLANGSLLVYSYDPGRVRTGTAWLKIKAPERILY